MKITIIGNCQSGAISKILKASLGSGINIPDIKPVHLLSQVDVPFVHQEVKTSDILIIQLIADNYGGLSIGTNQLKKLLPPQAKLIVIPNLHWEGYFPTLTYLKDSDGRHVTRKGYDCFMHDYHCAIIIAAFKLKIPIQKVMDIYNKTEHLNEWVGYNFKNSYQQLFSRESSCDIKISTYIMGNYKQKQLFFTFNHPSNQLLDFFVEQILAEAGITGFKLKQFDLQFFGDFVFPIFKFVKCSMEIEFEPSNFCIASQVTEL